MSLLSYLTFKQPIDVVDHAFDLKVSAHWANKLFQPDWKKVAVCGRFNEGAELKLILRDADGHVYTFAEIGPCSVTGDFEIWAKSGRIEDCIKENPGEAIALLWRQAHGLEEDHPMATDIKVSDFGRLTVSVLPCF